MEKVTSKLNWGEKGIAGNMQEELGGVELHDKNRRGEPGGGKDGIES